MKSFSLGQSLANFSCWSSARTAAQSSRAFFFGWVTAWAFVALPGCASFQILTQTKTLSESGFVARAPQTSGQRETYAALPPHKLRRGVVGGNVFYIYKDEKSGVVYIGGEEDYERYMAKVRRLVSFYETTEPKMMAYDMESDLQGPWYRAWGVPVKPSPEG